MPLLIPVVLRFAASDALRYMSRKMNIIQKYKEFEIYDSVHRIA